MATTQIPSNALLLVADGRKALFLRNHGTPNHVELDVERVLGQEDPPTREQGTDRPGRYRGGSATPRSAFEQTDWHQIGEDRFAAEVAATVNRLAAANQFQHLILVAPPKALSELRTHLQKNTIEKVLAEIPKDLTNQPVHEIVRTLTM